MAIFLDYETEDPWPSGTDSNSGLQWQPAAKENGVIDRLISRKERAMCGELSTETSCRWLLDSSKYRDWINSGTSVFWLQGAAGSGKSVLSNMVAEYLRQEMTGLVVTFSFPPNAACPENLLLESIFGALQDQRPHGQYNQQIQCFLWSAKSQDTFMRLRQFQKYLGLILETCAMNEHVLLVIDGLDDSNWAKTRILDVLTEIAFRSQNSARISCMISSRKARGASVRLNIVEFNLDTSQSVRNEVGKLITKSLRQLSLKYPERQSDLEEIEATFMKLAGTNFLWASMTLNEIARVLRLRGIFSRALIGGLPTTLEGLYRRILNSVSSEKVRLSQTARQVFAWAMYATRPLRASELMEALSTRAPNFIPASQLFPESSRTELSLVKEELHTVFGGLLTLSRGETLNFIHRSAKEFCVDDGLRETALDYQMDASYIHEYLAQVCLQYLLDQDKIQLLLFESSGQMELTKTRNSFLDYAAKSWFVHYRIAETRSMYLPSMLQHCLIKVQWEADPDHEGYRSKTSRIFALCAQHGFAKLGQVCIDKGADVNEICHQRHETPLQAAAANGHLDFVALLISRGTQINAFSELGLAPLHLAAFKGHYGVCRLLLGSGADKDARTREGGETPLHLAVGEQFNDVVRVLLAAGADKTLVTVTGETALHIAAEVGDLEICMLLLSKDSPRGSGNWPTWNQLLQLHLAEIGSKSQQRKVHPIPDHEICDGKVEMISRPQHKPFLLSIYDSVNVLLVTWAADDLDVEPEILKLKRAFQTQYNFKISHCILPSENSACHLTTRLLEFQRSENKTNKQLLILYYAGHAVQDCVEGIWAANKREDSPTLNVHSVRDHFTDHCDWILCWSTTKHTAKQLVDAWDSCMRDKLDDRQGDFLNRMLQSHKSSEEQTSHGTRDFAFNILIKLSSGESYKYLMNQSDAHARNRNGWTALHLAAARGHWDVCDLLLRYGCNPYEQTHSGKTALQLAVECKTHHGDHGDLSLKRDMSVCNISNMDYRYDGHLLGNWLHEQEPTSEEELEDEWILVGSVTIDK